MDRPPKEPTLRERRMQAQSDKWESFRKVRDRSWLVASCCGICTCFCTLILAIILFIAFFSSLMMAFKSRFGK